MKNTFFTIFILLVLYKLSSCLNQTYKVNLQSNETIKTNLNSNYTGNMSSGMINTIMNVIGAGEQKYSYGQLSQLSQFIGKALDKTFNSTWNTYIFNKGITSSDSYASYTYYTCYLNWENWGSYGFTYMIWKDDKCKVKERVRHPQSQSISDTPVFGSSLLYYAQQKIIQYVNDAVTYNGKDIFKNAQYIAKRLSPGYQSVLIAEPAGLQHDGYYCLYSQYWAWFPNYGINKWDYYLIRSH